MRAFGSIIDRGVKFREPSIPDRRLERVNPPIANHLDEGVQELFNYACTANLLDAAGDLLTLMQKWHERRSYDDAREVRIAGLTLARMEGELKRRRIMRGSRL